MKTEQLKPIILTANKQIEAILLKYDFLKKAVIFDNSQPFEKSFNLLEIALPNIQKVGTTDFDNLVMLFDKVDELTNYQINNPVFATCFVLFQNFDEDVTRYFRNNISPFVLCDKWEAGFPFNCFMATGEIPDFTTGTFLKLFCRIDPKTLFNDETPEIEIFEQKHLKQGIDKIIDISSGAKQPTKYEFLRTRTNDEIFDLMTLAKYQFQKFCIESHEKIKSLIARQKLLKTLLQAEISGKQNIFQKHLKINFKGTEKEIQGYLFHIYKILIPTFFYTNFENFVKAFSDSPDFKKIDWLTPPNDAICIFSGFEGFGRESKNDRLKESFPGLLDCRDRSLKMKMLNYAFNFRKLKTQNQLKVLSNIPETRRPNNFKSLLPVIEKLKMMPKI